MSNNNFKETASSVTEASDNPQKIQFAIVGCGPRGTYAFAALARRLVAIKPDQETEIFLIDPYISKGGEVYHTSQPSYLLMNTIAEQITTQPDHSVTTSTDITSTSSLAEWFRSNVSEALKQNAYLPRRFHGEYLIQARHAAAALLPANSKVHFIEAEVVAIKKDTSSITISLSNGSVLEKLSSVQITTGRGTPDSVTQLENTTTAVENPYPIESWSHNVSSSDIIGVQGLGLTAIDVILALTIGRGGSFEEKHGQVSYTPSGLEPKIVAWSRSGLPLLARASNQKGVDGRHIAQFLTYQKVNELKEQSLNEGRDGKLDFHKEILPLISKEILLAACLSYFYQKLPTENMNGDEILSRLSNRLPEQYQLNWDKLEKYSKIQATTQTEYISNMRRFLELDLKAANEGNIHNPYKCAADCLRDIRDQIRAAVDWCGLTPESMKRFENEFVPPYLRLAVGPPPIRIKQLLALCDAGILDLNLGPNPELITTDNGDHIIKSRFSDGQTFKLNKLIRARITSIPGGRMASALLNSGLCRFAENKSAEQSKKYEAFDVDKHNRAINPQGQSISGLYIFGALCEGVNWYTFAAARPFVGSRTLRDAEKWAEYETQRLYLNSTSNDLLPRGSHDKPSSTIVVSTQYNSPHHPSTDGRRDNNTSACVSSVSSRGTGLLRSSIHAPG